MVPGSIRRQVEDVLPFTYEDITLKLLDVENDRDACLIAVLYLSGRRITEVLALQKQSFHGDANHMSFDTFNEKVYRLKKMGNYTIQRGDKYYEHIRPHWRIDTPSGQALTPFITKTLDSLTEKDYLFKPLRGSQNHISRSMAYKIVISIFPDAWPHLFRHERFTEAARAYKNDLLSLHRFTFHHRIESSMPYIRAIEEDKL